MRQWFLKVVGDDIDEFVELAISLRQRVIGASEALLYVFELAIDPAQLFIDLGQLDGSQLECSLGLDLFGDVGEMATKMGHLLIGPVAGADVDFDRAGRAVRCPDANDQAQGLTAVEGLGERLPGTTAVVGVKHIEKRLLSQLIERPAQQDLFGGT